jgi:hypothetical protein
MSNQHKKNMKRVIILAGLILGFSVMTMSVSAQTASTDKAKDTKEQQAAPATKGQFTDANKDGVCDNYQSKAKNGKCANFTDKNKDGICDNCLGKGNCQKGNCCGKGSGNMNCNGNGPGKGCGPGMQNRGGNCPKK